MKAGGFSPKDIKRIIITHAHPDHVGAIAELVAETGAKRLIPEGERAAFEGEIPIPSPKGWLKPPATILENMKADQLIKDGDILEDVMGGLHAIATPGHAPGHMAYWHPERKVLFCGDTIFNMPPRTRLPFKMVTVDMAENIRSIAKMEKLRPEVICFGHGQPFTVNAAQKLTAFAKKVGAI